jgi:hypothetical protein
LGRLPSPGAHPDDGGVLSNDGTVPPDGQDGIE